MLEKWILTRFEKCCHIVAPLVDPKLEKYQYYPHIGNECIEKHTGKLIHYNFVKDDNLISSKYLFGKNDVLYGKINPQFGKVAFPKFIGLCSADMYPITCDSNVWPEFLKYVLLTKDFLDYTISLSMRSGMPKVNRDELKDYEFWLPNLEEQKAIATALSDVDNLIDNLEKLIEKKKKIKQGTMQELLTGKKRLPNYFGEWVNTTLGEIGVFKKGAGINREQAQTGEIPAVRYGELYTSHNDYIKKYYSKISQEIAKISVKVGYGDILFTCSGETKEEIGKCVAIKDKFEVYAGSDLIIMTPTIELNPIFMGTLLNVPYIAQQKASKAQGDAIVHISQEAIKELLVTIPSIEEQTAIANLLSDMDEEITTLDKKLAKTKALKQGMMQKLLSGEIRLV